MLHGIPSFGGKTNVTDFLSSSIYILFFYILHQFFRSCLLGLGALILCASWPSTLLLFLLINFATVNRLWAGFELFNPKSTGLFSPGEALGGGGVFLLCKIRPRHSRKLKPTGLIAYIMFYKYANLKAQQ